MDTFLFIRGQFNDEPGIPVNLQYNHLHVTCCFFLFDKMKERPNEFLNFSESEEAIRSLLLRLTCIESLASLNELELSFAYIKEVLSRNPLRHATMANATHFAGVSNPYL